MTDPEAITPLGIDSEEYLAWKNLDTRKMFHSEIAVIEDDDDWKTKHLKSQVLHTLHVNSFASMEGQRKLRIQLVVMESLLLEEREKKLRIEKADVETSPIKELKVKTTDQATSPIKELTLPAANTSERACSAPQIDSPSVSIKADEEQEKEMGVILDARVTEGPVGNSEAAVADNHLDEKQDQNDEMSTAETEVAEEADDATTKEPPQKARKSGRQSKKAKNLESMDNKENIKAYEISKRRAAKDEGVTMTDKVTTRRHKTKENEFTDFRLSEQNDSIDTSLDRLDVSTKDISPIEASASEERSVTDITGSNLKLDCLFDQVEEEPRQEPAKKGEKKRKQYVLGTSFKVPVLKKKIRPRR